jgi:putative oxidoreductase
LLGAILILTPSLVAFGALLLICIMIGATITHLFLIGGSPVPALVLLALSAIVAYARRDQLAKIL